MRHEEALARLSALLDDELTEEESGRLQAHLEACATCRGELERMRATIALLREAGPLRAPQGFAAAVRERLERFRTAPRPSFLERIGGLLRVPRWSWRTAAAATAVAVVVVIAANIAQEALLLRTRFQREVGVGLVTADRAGVKGGPSQPEGTSSVLGESRVRGVAQTAAVPLPPARETASLRRVIRTGEIEIEVEVFDDAARGLMDIAERAGGFMASSSYTDSGGTPRGAFVLRVPASAFGDVIRQVERLGKVQRRQVSGQDVTEEFVDLEARVRNLERHEARLLSLVERATKIADLMALEGEIARVRGEIERLTGRLRYLNDRVELATIQVEVTQKPKKASGGFWDLEQALERVKAAFLKTIRQMIAALEAVVALGAALLPLALVVALAWWLVRRAARRADRAA